MSDKYRYEIKFVLNETALSRFLSWLYTSTNCRKKYPERIVNSIYFDDISYSSVKDNLAGIPNRMKTRLRWYQNEKERQIGVPILEQKIKDGRLGTKSSIPIHSLENAIFGSTFSTMIFKIKEEVPHDHFASLEYLIPTLHVSYSRQYYESNNGLRITIDDNIKFDSHFSLNHKLSDVGKVSYRSKIVELKFDPSMKNYVSDLIRPLSLTPVRNSKYLTGLAMFGQVYYL